MNELNTTQKFSRLMKEGLIQEHSRNDIKRIENRWRIHTTVKQKTASELLAEATNA
jgi:hypothetical protein